MDKKALKYRKEAITALHVDEEINQLVRVVPPHAWIALVVFYILIVMVLLWGVFGSIPTRVEGKGILLSEDGFVYNAVSPPGGGRVKNILVKPGDFVKKGAIVAHLERLDLIEKMNLSQSYVESLKTEYKKLVDTATQELKNRHKDLEQQREILKISIETESKNLTELESLLKNKENNFKNGLLTLTDLENTRRDVYGSRQKIKQIEIQLKQQDIQEDDFNEQWRERLQEKKIQYFK